MTPAVRRDSPTFTLNLTPARGPCQWRAAVPLAVHWHCTALALRWHWQCTALGVNGTLTAGCDGPSYQCWYLYVTAPTDSALYRHWQWTGINGTASATGIATQARAWQAT